MNLKSPLNLELVGPGFIFYSPFAVSDIANGEDYLLSGFEKPSTVETQALQGKIVGVSTGSPGDFLFDFHSGYPTDELLSSYQYKLRLGIQIKDRLLCIRDLYDLMEWDSECPEEQKIRLKDGFYHITLLSSLPSSGILGDNQKVLVYLQKLNEMPNLKLNGVPTLC